MIRFDGEFISAETGEEKEQFGLTREQVISMIRRMKDGDSLVLNAREDN